MYVSVTVPQGSKRSVLQALLVLCTEFCICSPRGSQPKILAALGRSRALPRAPTGSPRHFPRDQESAART
eukprot:2421585-Pyramimonas_sp.AAC.1